MARSSKEAPMRVALSFVTIGVLVAGFAGTATAQSADAHKVMAAQEIKWGPAPPSLPPGAQAAVLYGDPGKDGMFVFQRKVPKGYRIPPHTHPKPEIVTVLSGTMRLGMGPSADPSKAKALP